MSLVLALVVGLLVVLMGYVAAFILKELKPELNPSLPEVCKTWNSNYVMEWTLFLTGVLTYGALAGAGYCA